MWTDRLDRFRAAWFRPIEPIRLDAFRIAFCGTLLLWTVHRLRWPVEWLTAEGFHASRWQVDHFGTALDVLLPPALVPVYGALLLGSTIALLVGWRVRAMACIGLACAIYAQLVDRYFAYTLDKIYIVGLMVLAAAPPARRWTGPDGEVAWVQSAWPVRVLQCTLLVLYFSAGWTKMVYGDWFETADVLWSQVQGAYGTELSAWMLRNLPREAWWGFQYSALAFEVLAPVLFAVKRLRPIAFVWGTGFHVMIGLTMYMIILFSIQTLSFYVLFVDAGHLTRIRDFFRGGSRAASSPRDRGAAAATTRAMRGAPAASGGDR